MTLMRRIIPCLDVLGGKVVKGIRFKDLRYAGKPSELAAAYEQQGADEIVFLDIGASPERRKILIDVVKETADVLSIPLTVGGGVRGLADIEALLRAGADKVSINTAAVKDPGTVAVASERFGRQCIVVAIDAKRVEAGRWEVYIYGGRAPTGLDALRWAKLVERLGAGEILLTSMDADGTRQGYDISLTRTVSENVGVPLIASGGAGDAEHIYEALTAGKADAALAASIFHYGMLTVRDVKELLASRGVPVRL
ncbi:TPA: imidazole glycerol phosphate synthase subunit HisF [Candidatus Bathyarchaeota archaeon]|nr:imidazole glycerol phosphate synthase subunit HisF [Candidatus Bathyarchaeota archaeon]